ncbi:hypothetical protein K488DRAFT_80716 [Vararia minispora EC-137]|uniref:Uncharacterized protein n=1 Tax=Vararia minispora EC-137 TaxID=1314806 RepID=A0ACB8Q9F9_9AGAM|nr:hypothetical protein K488DRAFT_80716 [Vararia minispora EC-137]
MTLDNEETTPSAVPEESCPACTEAGASTDIEKESWVRCDYCKTWYHWRCVGDGGDLSVIDKWYCQHCREENPGRVVTMKPPARKSARKKPIRDYANLHVGSDSADARAWVQMLSSKSFAADLFKRMAGAELCQEWLNSDPSAMKEPVVIPDPDGLGMKMPPRDLTVGRIAQMLGVDMPVEVIDVATQSGLSGWTVGRWAEYYQSSERDKIRNVISLEISGTELSSHVLPPRLVRDLDWVEKYWPSSRKGKGHVFPKVQLYCLMGVEGAWTDWHIDFAGSSVYYHVLRGAKTFLFIRPTAENLASYQRWSGSDMQTYTWLGDLVDEVVKVELTAGNTMIIPTGWIHAVHTPVDALVFGGNFVHSYNAALQLRVREIEIATRVPKKFRFPLFTRLSWYVGEKFLRDLKAREEFSTRILESMQAVAAFLVSQARDIEHGSEAARREAKEQIPSDRVRDPSALARELRWRVRHALHLDSDSDGVDASKSSADVSAKGRKRGRLAEDEGQEGVHFKNFQPKAWQRVRRTSERKKECKSQARSEMEDGVLTEDWLENVIGNGVAAMNEVTVTSRHVVTTKVRRTVSGLERQRIESVLEKWEWPEAKA